MYAHTHTHILAVIFPFLAFVYASTPQSTTSAPGITTITATPSATTSGSIPSSFNGSSSSISGTSNGTFTITATSSAHFPSLSGYPTCVSQCLALAASNANCSSMVAVDCYCQNSNFTDTIVSCVASQCYNDISEAENLAQQFCNLANTSTSLTFPTPPPATSSSSRMISTTSTSTTSTNTASSRATFSSNAGVGNIPAIDWKSTRSLALAMCIAIGGAAFGAVLL